MAELAVDFALGKLIQNLEQGLDRKAGEEVMRIMAEIEDMTEFLNDADTRRDTNSDIEMWVSNARRLAYRVEDLLDHHTFHSKLLLIILTTVKVLFLFAVGFFPPPFPWTIGVMALPFVIRMVSQLEPLLRSRRFLRELQGIRTGLVGARERMIKFEFQSTVTTERPGPEPRDGSPIHSLSVTMVGRDKELQQMKEWLCDKEQTSKDFNVIFVTGMVGTGKTTLAANAYDQVKLHFDCYAFAFMSRPFQPEAILRDMLESLYESRSESPPTGVDEMAVDSLQQKMAAYLQGKKYLLVVDDIGDERAWEILKEALPRSPSPNESEAICNGKVVLTTRDMGLPIRIFGEENRDSIPILDLKELSDEDAWTLFLERALPESNSQTREIQFTASSELELIGKTILQKCGRIPLAIKTVGALLSTKDATPHKWRKVLEKLDHLTARDSDENKYFVASGYADLPPVLKRCFLYCSLFPENYEIPRRKLVRLWVAEDFATSTSTSTTPEEAGEFQLRQLIERNMLQVARTGLNGEVTSCRVLWLMRKFARALSNKDDFCTVIPSGDEKEPDWDTIRRLAVHSNAEKLINSDMGTSNDLRTLLFFRMSEQQRNPFSIRKLPPKLKLLRVLELQGLNIQTLPSAVGDLVLLRYLGLRGTAIRRLPNKLFKLTHLQTLDIRDTKVKELPDLIALKGLRHLHLQSSFSDKVIGVKKGITWARDLKTLAGLKLKGDLVQELGTLGKLRKLSIGQVRTDDSAKLCSSINQMKQLHSLTLKCNKFDSLDASRLAPLYHLQKLKLGGLLHNSLAWITQITSLTYLYLWNSALKDDPLATLQGLPKLVLLSLCDAYNGKQIGCDAGGFPKLKKLSILHLTNLKEWRIESNAMPFLQKLFIGYCPELKDPPRGLENLASLQVVQVSGMPDTFEDRLREDIHEHGYNVQCIPQLALSQKLGPTTPRGNAETSSSRYEDEEAAISQHMIESSPS